MSLPKLSSLNPAFHQGEIALQKSWKLTGKSVSGRMVLSVALCRNNTGSSLHPVRSLFSPW